MDYSDLEREQERDEYRYSGRTAPEPQQPQEPLPGEPTDPDPGTAPSGSTAAAPGVMNGGVLVRVARSGADDLWVMAYEWPTGSGQSMVWQFDNQAQVTATFGANWWETVPFQNRTEEWFNDSATLLSSADEIVGVEGNFLRLMQDSMREAAVTAGLSDPSLQGLIAANPEWQQIVALKALGQLTDAQMMAELRRTDLWTQTLYPGISTLLGRTAEPEQAWLTYSNTVEQGLNALGYDRDPDGSYRQAIGNMLTKGVDGDLFVESVPTFVRAEQSTNFRSALGQWTQAMLGKDLDFSTWFDVLAGEAPPEIARVVELAQLQYAANATSVGINSTLLQRIAADTNLSEAQAVAAFNETERNLLALGDEGLGRYGLTQDELVSAFTGIQPPSGRSIEQVRLTAQKAAVELGLSDDVNTDLFVGFTPRGVPERPGLKALSPERA